MSAALVKRTKGEDMNIYWFASDNIRTTRDNGEYREREGWACLAIGLLFVGLDERLWTRVGQGSDTKSLLHRPFFQQLVQDQTCG